MDAELDESLVVAGMRLEDDLQFCYLYVLDKLRGSGRKKRKKCSDLTDYKNVEQIEGCSKELKV